MPTLLTTALLALTAVAVPPSPGVPATRAPALASTAPPALDAVGFTRLTVDDGDRPALEVGVWSPLQAETVKRPLVIISHGNGGDFRSHVDTAQALARAGFVVAALTHTGDNWRDQSRATDVMDRARQLTVLADFMLSRWEGKGGVDPQRVGAFGFSAGGFTVLVAAGGRPDLSRVVEHCRAHPTFYDCQLMKRQPVAADGMAAAARTTQDAQLKAVVVAAPALGFTFTREGLARVSQPMQLWQAGADAVLPAPYYVEPVREALGRSPEFHRAEGAGHFDFLAPCTANLVKAAPAICAPTPGFDRVAFHEQLNREVVRFFQASL